MALRVLIAPDKFKGTLTAWEAARAMEEGWRSARPGDHLTLLPISDGGDGFGELLGQILGGKRITVNTVDAAHRPVQCAWWWVEQSRAAIIESAQVIGLARLPPGRFHPFELDTFGLGKVFESAVRHGAARCIIGLGGSATNDAGFGLARALGWRFLDRDGTGITQWTELDQLERIRRPKRIKLFRSLAIAVDVNNPLLGARGATRIYGPQKGLRAGDFTQAEKCLRRLAGVATPKEARWAEAPGTGAAGGLGFGLRCFMRGEFHPGFDLFARHSKLEQRLRGADLVVTGEGALDRSSAMGKGAGEVARRCWRLGIPCLGLAGIIQHQQRLERLFTQVHAIVPEVCGRDQALSAAPAGLRELARAVAASLRA